MRTIHYRNCIFKTLTHSSLVDNSSEPNFLEWFQSIATNSSEPILSEQDRRHSENKTALHVTLDRAPCHLSNKTALMSPWTAIHVTFQRRPQSTSLFKEDRNPCHLSHDIPSATAMPPMNPARETAVLMPGTKGQLQI